MPKAKLLLLALLGLLFLAGCATPPGPVQELVSVWNEAIRDGVISAEEAERIRASMAKVQEEAGRIDWPGTLGTIAGAAVTSFLGVNLYRNKREEKMWGPPPPEPEKPQPFPPSSTGGVA
jgi:hypothetical protein